MALSFNLKMILGCIHSPSVMDALVRVYSEASNETLRDQLLDAACQIVKVRFSPDKACREDHVKSSQKAAQVHVKDL